MVPLNPNTHGSPTWPPTPQASYNTPYANLDPSGPIGNPWHPTSLIHAARSNSAPDPQLLSKPQEIETHPMTYCTLSNQTRTTDPTPFPQLYTIKRDPL